MKKAAFSEKDPIKSKQFNDNCLGAIQRPYPQLTAWHRLPRKLKEKNNVSLITEDITVDYHRQQFA